MDFSQITEHLLIGTTPSPDDYARLRQMGVQLVINMRAERKPYPDPHSPPLPVLWLPSFDSPFFPIPIRHLVKGVLTALETIERGGKVYAHCAMGRHRGVAMGAAILIAQGVPADRAIEVIKLNRQIAHPNAWYIQRRILRFASEWPALG